MKNIRLTNEEKKELRNIIKHLKYQYLLCKKIFLFGSRVKGKKNPSDLDVLVIVKSETDELPNETVKLLDYNYLYKPCDIYLKIDKGNLFTIKARKYVLVFSQGKFIPPKIFIKKGKKQKKVKNVHLHGASIFDENWERKIREGVYERRTRYGCVYVLKHRYGETKGTYDRYDGFVPFSKNKTETEVV